MDQTSASRGMISEHRIDRHVPNNLSEANLKRKHCIVLKSI